MISSYKRIEKTFISHNVRFSYTGMSFETGSDDFLVNKKDGRTPWMSTVFSLAGDEEHYLTTVPFSINS
jgi:hypothetical protein